jgi:UDP-glucose-4-epimerase GalE
MKTLVTGGAGYVGSHAVRVLLEGGHDVVVLDDLSTGHREAVPEGLLEEGSLLDRGRVDAVFDRRRPEAVLHFASHCAVGESVADPRKYYRDNLTGAIHLFEAALDRAVRFVVFSSTCAVYGDPVRVPMDEDHPRAPVSPYGETKLAIERMLQAYDAAYGLRSACLRYFNAAGADPAGGIGEKHDPEGHLIPRLLDVAHEVQGAVTVNGTDYPTPDGTCVRDYVHVTDLARAHALALAWMEREDRSGVFNLGTGTGRSVAEVVETVRRISGRPVATKPGARRPGDPPVLVARAERARRELGWEPSLSSLETIVETAWAWRQVRDAAFRS